MSLVRAAISSNRWIKPSFNFRDCSSGLVLAPMPENSPIAIVDDEPRMRAAHNRLLRANGYGVMSFGDGAALLAACIGDRHHWARPTRERGSPGATRCASLSH
jgi:hypothetical protein